MKKRIALIALAMACLFAFTACTPAQAEQTLKVAAIETAYGTEVWQKIADAFTAGREGVKIEMTLDKNLEDVLGPAMKAGDYPDVVHLATGRPAALTETLTKEKALLDLTDILDQTVPGESRTIRQKLVPGFTDTLVTNPYNDGRTYLMPMLYSPCGLFYNAGLFEEKGWAVPETWEEMWALGDKAAQEGIALFTYPTTGYFDAFLFALMLEAGGPEFFNRAMTYEDGIWETPEATAVFQTVEKLARYTEKTTPANANNTNFLKNQQLVLDNKALFMPSGTWVVEEMAQAPRSENFEWGFTALPAMEEGGDRYAFTFFEQVWIPSQSENQELAKEFVAFLYSDEAAQIFAEVGGVQPIEGASQYLTGENLLFYSIYDNGAKAAMGGFASTPPVEGVSIASALFDTVNSIVTGDKTVAQWQAEVEKASDALRQAMQ